MVLIPEGAKALMALRRSTIYRYTESGNLWDNKFLFKMELKPINPKIKSDTITPSPFGLNLFFT